ncbi:MAG: hypothetical protein ACXVAU_11395 [Mucilaginibacter sp.]
MLYRADMQRSRLPRCARNDIVGALSVRYLVTLLTGRTVQRSQSSNLRTYPPMTGDY